jgi:hypothetical protein
MNDNGYFSHSENRNGCKEPLIDHLTSVASRAALNASFFDAITEAKMTGLRHDLGNTVAEQTVRPEYGLLKTDDYFVIRFEMEINGFLC